MIFSWLFLVFAISIITENNAQYVNSKLINILASLASASASSAKRPALRLLGLSELLSNAEMSGCHCMPLDVRLLHDNCYLLVYSRQTTTANTAASAIATHYEYDYARWRFKRDQACHKAGLVLDAASGLASAKYATLFAHATNVDELKVALPSGKYILDNEWNLYDMADGCGKLLHNVRAKLTSPQLKSTSPATYNYALAQFVLDARYLLVFDDEARMLLLVRCYDVHVVASIRCGERVTCLSVGGSTERTVCLGTVRGDVLAIRLLIDMEFKLAVDDIASYRLLKRQPQQLQQQQQQQSICVAQRGVKSTNQLDIDYTQSFYLSNDLKRVSQATTLSTSRHHLLSARESQRPSTCRSAAAAAAALASGSMSMNAGLVSSTSAADTTQHSSLISPSAATSSTTISTLSRSRNLSATTPHQQQQRLHSGILKQNLSTLTCGIKHASLISPHAQHNSQRYRPATATTTRACVIQ